MQNKISSFAKLEEPERMLFIAQLHHAIWHDESMYLAVKSMMQVTEDKVPEAVFFPVSTELHESQNSTL